jgi:serine/threonine protein kinase
MTYQPTPAEQLEGRVLGDGWRVVRRMPRASNATGGWFCVCYEVEREKRTAFLKALDIHGVLRSSPEDVMTVMQQVSTTYNYELELLEACEERQMDRVVRPLDSGQQTIEPSDMTSIVFFLVFELAEGDLRQMHDSDIDLDLGQAFRILHDVAVGIRQLHSAEIAHQDVKPSNVLAFAEDTDAQRPVSRIADLGRASRPSALMPHDESHCAGDKAHTAPELLYATVPPDWEGRRACDLYQLGSLLLFLFTGMSATAAWLNKLQPEFRPWSLNGMYRGTYEDALPHLRSALQAVCEDFPTLGDSRVRDVAIRVFRELCDPDPELRGHTRDRAAHRDRYSVERYITEFDLEARRTARQLATKAA